MQVFLIEYDTVGGEHITAGTHATVEGAKRAVEAQWNAMKGEFDAELPIDEMQWHDDYNEPGEVCVFGVDADDDPDGELPCWTIKVVELGE